MTLVEQAIFASLDADGHSAYQVVAQSAGVCPADARELTVWEPSSDALFDASAAAESLNFHPLPSGAHCISRSLTSGRHRDGARRIYTHCLIVSGDVLARFANNPFAVAHAMSEHGLWRHPGVDYAQLDPLPLPGGAPPVDQPLLRQLAMDPGPRAMAALVQASRDAVCLGVGGPRPADWIAGLFSCLLPACRPEFSFTTGLKFSPQRPFRIVALSDDPAEHVWVANYPNVVVLEASEAAAGSMPCDGWARLIEHALATDQVAFLAAQIAKRRFDLSLDDLPALGLQLLESLDWMEYRDGEDLEITSEEAACDTRSAPAATASRAHAAHRQFQKSAEHRANGNGPGRRCYTGCARAGSPREAGAIGRSRV